MTSQTDILRAELETATRAAQAGAALIRAAWGKPPRVEHKGDVDLVTETDLAAEAAVLAILRATFPGDVFVSEEDGRSGLEGASRWWWIDPLDGTTNFAHGFPHFAVSIASEDADGLRVGVVLEPITQRVFAAARGMGATLNGAPLRASLTPDLNAALLATGFPYDRRTNPDNNVHRVAHLIRRCQGIRRAGAAALDLAYVAAGWLDGYWEDRLKPWDLAAGALLVREAGGLASDFDLGPLSLQSGRCVASNGHFHEQLAAAVLSAPALLFSEPESTP
jgi:myo-inositol-1(or 4)-monophosphatase